MQFLLVAVVARSLLHNHGAVGNRLVIPGDSKNAFL